MLLGTENGYAWFRMIYFLIVKLKCFHIYIYNKGTLFICCSLLDYVHQPIGFEFLNSNIYCLCLILIYENGYIWETF